jgi:hypothetical protein
MIGQSIVNHRRVCAVLIASLAIALSGCAGFTDQAEQDSSAAAEPSSNSGPATAIAALNLSRGSSAIPAHVLTAEYVSGGDGGFTGAVDRIAPYLSWANDPPLTSAAKYKAAGLHVFRIIDPNRAYKSANDFAYTDLVNTYSGAIAKDCGGDEVTTKNGDGVFTDPRVEDASKHFNSILEDTSSNSPGIAWDAWFVNDVDNTNGIDSDHQACNYSAASWMAATQNQLQSAEVNGQRAPLILNALELAFYDQPQLTLMQVPNVVAGAFASCYGGQSGFGLNGDYVNSLNRKWAVIENSEIAMNLMHKGFWCLNANANPAAASIAHRLYVYSSFLLTYDVESSVYETLYASPSHFRVMPETGFVAAAPLVAEPADITALRTPPGNFAREYAKCYYRGKLLGPCAVVVNPDDANGHEYPFGTKYGHTAVLRGGALLDGGRMTFDGPRPTKVLAPVSGVIAVR